MSEPHCRRPRYSLRCLLVIMTALAALLGWEAFQDRRWESFLKRREAAYERIEREMDAAESSPSVD